MNGILGMKCERMRASRSTVHPVSILHPVLLNYTYAKTDRVYVRKYRVYVHKFPCVHPVGFGIRVV